MAYINGNQILFSAVITGAGGGSRIALNAPSISLNLYTATLTITDTLNGNFASGYKIYIDNTLIATVTNKTVVLTNYTEYTEDATIKVCATGENFIDSEFATVEWTKPKLYTPSIEVSPITSTLTITDTNGGNVRAFEIYANGELLTTVTEKSVILSDYSQATELQIITVKALTNSDEFIDSDISASVEWIPIIVGTEGLEYQAVIQDRETVGYMCTGLGTATKTDIVIPSVYNNLPVISVAAVNDVSASKFTNATSIYIPDSVTSIGVQAFKSCKNLKSVRISAALNILGERVFQSCSSLTEVVFAPNSVLTEIGYIAFSHCTSLESITIPDSVTNIGNSLFMNCANLTSINIPRAATTIDAHAFNGCANLTSINIPRAITTIGYCAFDDCTNLTDVYYEGTAEEWASITIDGNGNNNLINATIHYNS